MTCYISFTAAGQVRTSPAATEENARIQGHGVTPSAKWIGVRDTDGLSTLLTDHLGSILGDCPHVACGSWGFAESGSIDGLGTLGG